MLNAKSSTKLELQRVEARTRGIIFLGTPFHGSAKAKLGETLRQILSVVRNTNSKLLVDLQLDSDYLSELVDQFAKWVERRSSGPDAKVDYVCFFEETGAGGSLLANPQRVRTMVMSSSFYSELKHSRL